MESSNASTFCGSYVQLGCGGIVAIPEPAVDGSPAISWDKVHQEIIRFSTVLSHKQHTKQTKRQSPLNNNKKPFLFNMEGSYLGETNNIATTRK